MDSVQYLKDEAEKALQKLQVQEDFDKQLKTLDDQLSQAEKLSSNLENFSSERLADIRDILQQVLVFFALLDHYHFLLFFFCFLTFTTFCVIPIDQVHQLNA